MTDVITALKRMERAGSEDSRQTEKLLNAAGILGQAIVDAVGHCAYNDDLVPGPVLPRDYYASSFGIFVVRHGCEAYVHDSRGEALSFARDIATGWLDELAQWLEQRGTESAAAAETLAKAAEAMR